MQWGGWGDPMKWECLGQNISHERLKLKNASLSKDIGSGRIQIVPLSIQSWRKPLPEGNLTAREHSGPISIQIERTLKGNSN